MIRHLLSISCAFFFLTGFSQSVKLLNEGTRSSFRGLSVVNDRVVWVSGSGGVVGKSIDSGNTWQFIKIPGFEQMDFRDIEAFDDMSAIVMGIDCPAYILKTIDGGVNWKVVFKDTTKGMFLDAMEFWNEQSGIVIGDPIKGKLFVARTFNEGNDWREVPLFFRPTVDSGEACFASSGTNVRKLSKSEAIIISGGLHSNLFIRNSKTPLPITQGTESTGANSIAVKNKKCWMVAGGDFNQKENTEKNLCFTKDAGESWLFPLKAPSGYRSCVEYLHNDQWITCGLNGVDITKDGGYHFKKISDVGFHVCRKAKKGKAVFLAGGNGRIGKLIN